MNPSVSKKCFPLIIVLLMSAYSVGVLADTDKPTIAVMPLEDEAGQLKPEVLESATGYLRDALATTNQFIVIEESRRKKKLDKIIKQKKKESYRDCYDERCQIPLGKALSADSILRAKIRKLGVCVLSVELIDLAKEATVAATKRDFDCDIEGLKQAIDETTSELSETIAKSSPPKANSDEALLNRPNETPSPSKGVEAPANNEFDRVPPSDVTMKQKPEEHKTSGVNWGWSAEAGYQSIHINDNQKWTEWTRGFLSGGRLNRISGDTFRPLLEFRGNISAS